MIPAPGARKDQRDKGGCSQHPPFFFWTFVSRTRCSVLRAPQSRDPCRNGSRLCVASLVLRRVRTCGVLCTCTGGQSRLSGDTPRSRLERSWPFGIAVLLIPGRAAGRPARADPDAAGRADGLCRADRGDPSAGAAAGGTRELDHRRVRLHPEALRFHAAQHHLSRRRRRQGLDLRHLFAAARQSQPYRFQRAVAVAVRQRAGAAVRCRQVLRIHGGDGRGRRAGASRHP